MIKLMMLTRKKYHITLKKGFLYHSVSALSLSLSALSLSLSLTHSLSLSLPSLITRCLSISIHAPLPYSLTPITPEAWCHEPPRVLWTYFLSVHDTQSLVYIIGSDPVQRNWEILRPSSCLIEPARAVYYWIKMLSPVSSKSIASYLQRQYSSSFHQLKASPEDLQMRTLMLQAWAMWVTESVKRRGVLQRFFLHIEDLHVYCSCLRRMNHINKIHMYQFSSEKKICFD